LIFKALSSMTTFQHPDTMATTTEAISTPPESQDMSDDQLFLLLKDAEERLRQNGAPTSQNQIALQKPAQPLASSMR
jgi:hypothetical protein